jgi:hypothetical protein
MRKTIEVRASRTLSFSLADLIKLDASRPSFILNRVIVEETRIIHGTAIPAIAKGSFEGSALGKSEIIRNARLNTPNITDTKNQNLTQRVILRTFFLPRACS